MKKIKITFLGSGSAFVPHSQNLQSNILIEDPSGYITAFDCGGTFFEGLKETGHMLKDIDSIFISHLHAEHIGGLEQVAFKTMFDPDERKKIQSTKYILKDLWEYSLRGGLDSIETKQPTQLSDYFYVEPTDFYFKIGDIGAALISTDHANMDSYGLFLNDSVLITGDVKFGGLGSKMYKNSDIIFQDCDFATYPGGVHAQFHELSELPPEIKSKMYLYHYDLDATGLGYDEMNTVVITAGFLGLVKRGQVFEF